MAENKNCEIEVLRGFAILFTVVLHLKLLLGEGSWLQVALTYLDFSTGVDLFLVISGYVITHSIIQSQRSFSGPRRILMYSFWIKRVFRLLPAAWLWIVTALILQVLVARGLQLEYSAATTLLRGGAALFHLMNVYMPSCIAGGGGLSCVVGNYLGHYWSLSLEEQFYLVFPLMFFFLGRRWLVLLLVVALLLQATWQRPMFTFAWYLKTDALCWGILLAFFSQTRFYPGLFPAILRGRYLAALAGLLSLVLLPVIAAQVQGLGQYMRPYGVALVALMGAGMVWLASYDSQIYLLGGTYSRVMLYLGSRSYALYLSHLVVINLLRDTARGLENNYPVLINQDVKSTLLVVLAVILSLGCAELTYRYVESVFRPRGREIAARLKAGN